MLDPEANWRGGPITAERAEWRAITRDNQISNAKRARAWIQLGEFALGTHDSAASVAMFERAEAFSAKSSGDRGLAAYDRGVALFTSGRFPESRDSLKAVLKSALHGYNRKTALEYERHAAACAGYHASHAALGIPEPPALDPLCGVAGLAVALRVHGMRFDKGFVAGRVKHDGEGSDLNDLARSLPSLGLTGRVVRTDEKGLMALPKPLVAHVENDHFVAVVRADSRGVAYVCSDCGAWPGGEVKLTWTQWRALEADSFLAVAPRGGAEAAVIEAMEVDKTVGTHSSTGRAFRLTSAHHALTGAGALLAARLKGHAFSNPWSYNLLGPPHCGMRLTSASCSPWLAAPHDCPPSPVPGPLHGDPINLATGEEEYTPAPDLKIYNAIGPSFVFQRTYNSLSNAAPTGFGSGWTHNFNYRIEREVLSGVTTVQLRLPDGTTVALTAAPPTVSTPVVAEVLPNGIPLVINYCYDGGQNYFTVAFPDQTTWTFGYTEMITDLNPPIPPTFYYYNPSQITNRLGQYVSPYWYPITLNSPDPNMTSPGSLANCPALGGINDSSGNPLLYLDYDANGGVDMAFDPSLTATDIQHAGLTYQCTKPLAQPTNIPAQLMSWYTLTAVASPTQVTYDPSTFSWTIAPMTTIYPYLYNYTLVSNLEGVEMIPVLNTIQVPDPSMLYLGVWNGPYSTATIYYDTYGGVSSIKDSNLNVTNITPNDTGTTLTSTTVTTTNGATEIEGFTSYINSSMYETKRTWDGAITPESYTYCLATDPDPFRVAKVTNGNSLSWNFTWDNLGNLVTSTTPKATVTTYTRDYANFPFGDLTEIQQTGKAPTFITPDASGDGLIDAITTPAPYNTGVGAPTSVTTTFGYTAAPFYNLKSITSPGNNAASARVVTFAYTQASPAITEKIGEPLTVTDDATPGNVWNYSYDERDNVLQTSDPVNPTNPTSTAYNYSDQPTVTTLPTPGTRTQTTVYAYTGGPPTSQTAYATGITGITGSQTYTNTLAYGHEGELLSRSGFYGAESYGYDAAYNRISLYDGNSNQTKYTFDYAGRPTSVTMPGAATSTSVTYDPASNVLTRTDANGTVATCAYTDADGMLSGVAYLPATAPPLGFGYDAYDRVNLTTDGTGSETTSYDDLDDAYSVTRTYTGVPAQTVAYQFFPDGSRETMTAPGGTWGSLYDSAGRLVRLNSPVAYAAWVYDLDSRVHDRNTDASQINTVDAYNSVGMLTGVSNKIAGTQISNYSGAIYGAMLDLQGFSASVPAVAAQTVTANFNPHNSVGQMTTEAYSGGTTLNLANVYDAAGNPTTFGNVSGLHYANSLSQRSDAGFGYDANGNATTYAGTTVGFDGENRMTGFASALTNGYRGDDLRGWKSANLGVTKTYFVYDGSLPIAEINSAGTVLATNVFGDDGLIARKTAAVTNYYAFDLQGNATQYVSGTTPAVTASTAYGAYGKPWNGPAPTDPFGFNAQSGYYRDAETGLYHLGYREYDPAAGRWLQRDPIGYDGGFNLYGYANGSPLGAADPSGTGPLMTASILYVTSDPIFYGSRFNRPDSLPIPAAPPYYNAILSYSYAQDLRSSLVDSAKDPIGESIGRGMLLLWFKGQVHPGGYMDFKHLDLQHGDVTQRLADYGNFNFGALGCAAGISDQLLLGKAREAAMKSKGWNPGDYSDPTSAAGGDQWRDQFFIRQGLWYAHRWFRHQGK